MSENRIRRSIFGACLVSLTLCAPFIANRDLLAGGCPQGCPCKVPRTQACSGGPFQNCPFAVKGMCSGTTEQVQDGLFGCVFQENLNANSCVPGTSSNNATCVITYNCMVKQGSNPVQCVFNPRSAVSSTDAIQMVTVPCSNNP